MKGLSTTILIVVTAVVILVAALVMLTIFGQGIQNVATITQAESLCISSAQITCTASGNTAWPPATWNTPTFRVAGGAVQSCGDILKNCNCNMLATGCK